jgi:hypothetical protein
MGSYKASRVFNLPQKHHSVMSKRTEKLKWSNKTKLGRKQVLHCEVENDVTDTTFWSKGSF